jgi:hypothetical protein
MPTPPVVLPLQPVSRSASLLPPKRLKADFPKRAQQSPVRSALLTWQRGVAAPGEVKNPDIVVKGVVPTRAAFTKFRAVTDAGLAPDAMAKQGLGTDQLIGTLFTALATQEFIQMEAEYRRRRGRAGSTAQVDAEWQKHVRSFSAAFASAGITGVGEPELRRYASELNANKANRDAIIAIANSGRDAVSSAFTAAAAPVAVFVPDTGVFRDPGLLITNIIDLCDDPISEGSFTKHFSHSVSLSVRIKYPCGISWSGIKWCKKTVTLASVSFSVAVDIGYRVTCCGATVWGQASAEVCATIVGIKVCANCTAKVTGVAGVGRTAVSSGCQYGIGINATLKCTLAGATILNLAYPFGWTVTGPCPPAGLC